MSNFSSNSFNRRERIALDKYLISRKFYANGNFIRHCLSGHGFTGGDVRLPPTVSWLAQSTVLTDPEQKITRPRQIFVGHSRRELPTFEVMLQLRKSRISKCYGPEIAQLADAALIEKWFGCSLTARNSQSQC